MKPILRLKKKLGPKLEQRAYMKYKMKNRLYRGLEQWKKKNSEVQNLRHNLRQRPILITFYKYWKTTNKSIMNNNKFGVKRRWHSEKAC